MSFLKNLFGRLFGRKPGPTPLEDFQVRQQASGDQWMARLEDELRGWVPQKLQQEGELAFSWESGGDEAFLEFAASSPSEESMWLELEEFVVRKLDIPDAGEFQMRGKGVLFLSEKTVWARFSSVYQEIVDYNEETEEEVYGPEEAVPEEVRALFRAS